MRHKPDLPQPLSLHLRELRGRLLWSVVFWGFACCLTYQFRNFLITALQHPVKDTLYYTSPTGGFQLVFGVVLISGFILSLPFTVTQVLLFVAPALSEHVHKKIYRAAFASILLTTLGVWFGYTYALPSTLGFLRQFSNQNIHELLTLDSYVSFISHYLIAFAIAFQMPVIVYAVNLFYPLTLTIMLKGERWVILLSFIAAAFISPSPDIFNQTMVAGPIILLYQASLIIVWLSERKRKQVVLPRPAPKPPKHKHHIDGVHKRHK